MLPLKYTKNRLIAFIGELNKLLTSEFPYYHPEEALHLLKRRFEYYLIALDKIDPQDEDSIRKLCNVSNQRIAQYLPYLGFILRSTNVRNAFEVFGPVLRLAGDIVEPEVSISKRKTRLILSSEWYYSPIIFHHLIELPHFVLVGLPAPESSNPLLVPLYGHELGHLVWANKKVIDQIKPKIRGIIFEKIRSQFPKKKIEDIADLFYFETWSFAEKWALKYAEETFCDLLGLYIFKTSFLHAFSYLISPIISPSRLYQKYPSMKVRVNNLVKAAINFSVGIPEGEAGYTSLFDDSIISKELSKEEKFLVSLADNALEGIIDQLINIAKEIADSTVFNDKLKKYSPSPDERDRIYNRFVQVVPAEKCKTLSDILNAAWKAYKDPALWENIPKIKEKKEHVLKNLVLKNIEVFEYEQILGESE